MKKTRKTIISELKSKAENMKIPKVFKRDNRTASNRHSKNS